jgi:hypothetical protein
LGQRASGLLHELRFQPHRADAVDLAVDVMVAVGQADVLDLGAHFHDQGRALDLQVLDDRDGVAVLQHVADGILDDAGFFGDGLTRWRRPLMAAFRADELRAVLVGVDGLALGAGGQGAHGGSRQAGKEKAPLLAQRGF